MNIVEINAAGSLLDQRLKMNVPAPALLRLLGKKTISLWIKRPLFQNLLRMSKLFAQMDIDLMKLDDGDSSILFIEIAKHGVTASRIIAHSMIRGVFASWLLNRPLAWYLRCHMDARTLAELTKVMVVLSTGEDFVSIIRSVARMRVTEPILSQPKKTGS